MVKLFFLITMIRKSFAHSRKKTTHLDLCFNLKLVLVFSPDNQVGLYSDFVNLPAWYLNKFVHMQW
jgi:hypothetical protein